jgi:hypothetical protein
VGRVDAGLGESKNDLLKCHLTHLLTFARGSTAALVVVRNRSFDNRPYWFAASTRERVEVVTDADQRKRSLVAQVNH